MEDAAWMQGSKALCRSLADIPAAGVTANEGQQNHDSFSFPLKGVAIKGKKNWRGFYLLAVRPNTAFPV
jgi:hypothetical protein